MISPDHNKIINFFGDWSNIIDIKELQSVIDTIDKSNKDITPNRADVFKAFKLCPFKDCKIVFLGMDPYAQKGVATGVLFGNSSDTPVDKLSPSLNVIKEAAIDYTISHDRPIKFDQTLESWAKQGILMINSALTTTVGKTGSHILLWRPFMKSLLTNLSTTNPGILYVLFGTTAKSFLPYIKSCCNILMEDHPAYYVRTNKRMSSDVFKQINNYMRSLYNTEIKWYEEF